MNTKLVGATFVALLVFISYFGGYKTGYSVAIAKDQADWFAKYGNDTNNDPLLKHSPSYDFAYIHGKVDGTAETRQHDIADCGDKLAGILVLYDDTRDAGKLLASGYVTIEQLRAAQKITK
jgi:hypothetical protein